MTKSKFQLHIFHTSDTHGHINSDSFTGKKDLPKGLSKISSFLKSESHQHVIKIDIGDTIQGSPHTYIYKENQKHLDNPFSIAFNHIKYDYFVVGNHDFNYGLNYLNHFVQHIHAKTLCGNVYHNQDLYFKYAYDVKIYHEDFKVVILGITNNYIPNWETKENINGLTFENAFDSAKKHIKDIKTKENPNLIIVGYHGGYECNLETGVSEKKNEEENLGCKIFTELKDIDLLLTGHEHRQLVLNQNQRVMVQPGYAGSDISHVTFTYEKENQNWMKKDVQAKLVSMKDYQDDVELTEKLNTFIEFSEEKLDQVIGYTDDDLIIEDPFLARLNKHKVVEYINLVSMKETNAMIGCCGLGNEVSGFKKTITLRDVLNTYVFPNTLYLCEIDGKTLYEALLHNAQFFKLDENDEIKINDSYLYPKKELYNYDMFDGIDYEIVVHKNQKNEVRNVTYQGRPIKEDDLFTITLNSYRMSGGGNISWHKNLKVIKNFPLDITEILINDIKTNKIIKVDYHHNIKVTKSNKES